MNLRKYLAVLLICVLLLTSLAMLSACGGAPAPSPAPSPEPAPAGAAPAGAAPAGTAPAQPAPGAPAETGSPDETDNADTAAEPELTGTYVRVGALRGPSGMSMAPLMQWGADGDLKNSYHFTLGGSPEDMTAGLISGELDIAQLPINVAALLYQRLEGDIRVINVNTLGVLFILDRTGEINEISDLRGRTINITGQGATPQFALEHILRQNGMEPGTDVEIIFNVEHAELAAQMVAGNVDIGMLPQPFVTTVLNNTDDINIAIDLSEAWSAAVPGTRFVQGVVVVRREFLNEHPDAVKLFLQDHQRSVNFVNSNIPDAAVLMELFDIIPAPIAAQAIPRSNLVHIEGEEMHTLINPVLAVLYEANPQAVGGAMPDEEFFFLG